MNKFMCKISLNVNHYLSGGEDLGHLGPGPGEDRGGLQRPHAPLLPTWLKPNNQLNHLGGRGPGAGTPLVSIWWCSWFCGGWTVTTLRRLLHSMHAPRPPPFPLPRPFPLVLHHWSLSLISVRNLSLSPRPPPVPSPCACWRALPCMACAPMQVRRGCPTYLGVLIHRYLISYLTSSLTSSLTSYLTSYLTS